MPLGSEQIVNTSSHELDLWHLGPITGHPGRPGQEIFGLNALAAHKTGALGKGVTVAIIDSGADHEHPNITDAVIQDESRSFEPYDDGLTNGRSDGDIHNRYDAHGTALAGVVAGRRVTPPLSKHAGAQVTEATGAHDQFVGVAPESRVVVIRLFTNFQPEQFLAALDHARDKADIILLARTLPQVRKAHARSGTGAADAKREALLEKIDTKLSEIAVSKPVVCAAGNGGFDELSFPANLPETIAVGASNELGWRSTYSQYGAGLDVVAPSSDAELASRDAERIRLTPKTAKARGMKLDTNPELHTDRLGLWGIVTTDNQGEFGYVGLDAPHPDFTPITGPARFGGTSAAAAQIAGVVALMISANDDLREQPEAIRQILHDTAVVPAGRNEGHEKFEPEAGWNPEFGWGLVDAAAAVEAAKKGRPAA